MQTDYAGQTVPLIDPVTGVITPAQIFVAVLGASSFTFAMASLSQQLPDWIDAQCRALSFIGGVPRAIVCDNLKAGVVNDVSKIPTYDFSKFPTFGGARFSGGVRNGASIFWWATAPFGNVQRGRREVCRGADMFGKQIGVSPQAVA